MRDAKGIYMGDSNCRFWGGEESRKKATCCGGRIIERSMIHCSIHGVIAAESLCNASCRERRVRE